MMLVVDDANMIRFVVLVQVLANGNQILWLTCPPAMVIEPQLATHLAGLFDQWQDLFRRLLHTPHLRFALGVDEHFPDLRVQVIFLEQTKGNGVRIPEREILQTMFLVLKNLFFKCGNMLLTPVISDPS